MGDFVKAAVVNDIPEGSMTKLVVKGEKIALSKINNEFYAISDTCSHDECSLSEQGFLDGKVVTCGCHGATFDVTNGKVLSLPAVISVKSYPTRVVGSEVQISI